MDLLFKDGKKCLLCRQYKSAHDGGDYDDSSCMETLRKLLGFIEDYRLGLMDREDFDLAVAVRKGRILNLGNPRRVFRGAHKQTHQKTKR